MQIALLTLERHRNGRWITKLVASIQSEGAEVLVVSLESVIDDPCIEQLHTLKQATILVNRVSDAAEPHLVKACIAVLEHAKMHGLRIFNGPRSYSLCSNKWCHHVLFGAAGLQCPRTVRIRTPLTDRRETLRLIEKWFDEGKTEFLLKPNSGGFGSGMVKFSRSDFETMDFPTYADSVGLIQEYIRPCDGKIYRVWFLAGRVQCAVSRNVTDLTSGCAGGSCSLRPKKSPPTMEAFHIPQAIIEEIEKQLLPLIPDADAGSVEYLNNEIERLYFDLNLLSTLPDPDSVVGSDTVWDSAYDPWAQLSSAILGVGSPKSTPSWP